MTVAGIASAKYLVSVYSSFDQSAIELPVSCFVETTYNALFYSRAIASESLWLHTTGENWRPTGQTVCTA